MEQQEPPACTSGTKARAIVSRWQRLATGSSACFAVIHQLSSVFKIGAVLAQRQTVENDRPW